MPRNPRESKPDRRGPRTPAYRKHRASGKAVVTLNGRDHYLGPFGTKASRNEYDRLIGEWLQNGRQPAAPEDGPLAVSDMLLRFWKHAQSYYVTAEGKPNKEADHFRRILKPVRELYGKTPAATFGPLSLKAVRQKLLDAGYSRKYINSSVSRIKLVFKWAVGEELIPPTVYQGLQAVPGLKRGRTSARESAPIKPVSDDIIKATLPHLPPTVRAMVELQRACGARPGEICLMRTADLDTTGKVWIYRPPLHKTMHHGRSRDVYLGPNAQAILKPFLKSDLQAFIFAPRQAAEERRQLKHENRKHQSIDRRGVNRKRKPERTPSDRYDASSYRQAIEYGCERAFPPPAPLARADDEMKADWLARLQRDGLLEQLRDWQRAHRWHPNQLRHSFATSVRKNYGLEAAQVLLGHAQADVTQIYAERDAEKAAAVALKIG